MCTSGALVAQVPEGAPVLLAAKTLDSSPTACWHGRLALPDGRRGLGTGLTSQVGVNAGMNEAGLTVLMSYLDHRPASEGTAGGAAPLVRERDRRGAANAAVLSRCATVEEALGLLYDLAPRSPEGPGGNHLLADASGTLAVFEHCEGRAQHQYYPEGYAARGNNGLLVARAEQVALPQAIQHDRGERYEAFHGVLRDLRDSLAHGLEHGEAIAALKGALARHHDDGPTAPGSICAHGVSVPGARSSLPLPVWTLTAVIFDPGRRTMTYSVGRPCLGNWETLRLEPEGAVEHRVAPGLRPATR